LSFKDPDVTDAHSVSVAVKSGPAIGAFLAGKFVDTTGSEAGVTGDIGWTFAANKAYVQSLAAGQTATQVFTISLTRGHGGTASQDVAITVAGVNDAPVIDGDPITASVQEDGGIASRATGQLTATDPDLTDTQTWSIVGASPAHVPNYHFTIDEFKVVKTGPNAFTFDDPFDDGSPPPSVPSDPDHNDHNIRSY